MQLDKDWSILRNSFLKSGECFEKNSFWFSPLLLTDRKIQQALNDQLSMKFGSVLRCIFDSLKATISIFIKFKFQFFIYLWF
jgi:hypothetical protein